MQSIFNSTMTLLAQSTMFFAKLKFRIWFDLSCNSRTDNQPFEIHRQHFHGTYFLMFLIKLMLEK